MSEIEARMRRNCVHRRVEPWAWLAAAIALSPLVGPLVWLIVSRVM